MLAAHLGNWEANSSKQQQTAGIQHRATTVAASAVLAFVKAGCLAPRDPSSEAKNLDSGEQAGDFQMMWCWRVHGQKGGFSRRTVCTAAQEIRPSFLRQIDVQPILPWREHRGGSRQPGAGEEAFYTAGSFSGSVFSCPFHGYRKRPGALHSLLQHGTALELERREKQLLG